jgi:hypothetical protein
VPPPDEPELPIPSPAAAQTPALTLAHDRGPPPAPQAAPDNANAVTVPEVTCLDSPPPETTELVHAHHQESEAAPSMVEKVAAIAPLPALPPQPAAARPDPLAPLMLLSEHERLALFT